MIPSRFYKYCDLIVENIEGGYYSPIRHYSDAMGQSGETMFGMDRRWGGAVVNDSEPGKKFWALVDANSATWAYNSKGGSVGPELRKLAAQIMWISYEKYFKQYLSPKAQKLVSKSPRLECHFFYACWNGVVRFKDFAADINKAVAAGTTKIEDLEQVAIKSRLNYSVSLIRIGGEKMQKNIWPRLPKRNGHTALWIAGGALILATAGGIILWNKYGKQKKIENYDIRISILQNH